MAEYVEFHPSMSLENQPPATTVYSPTKITASLRTDDVDTVYANRIDLWRCVDQILDSLRSLDCETTTSIDELRQLKKLHAICRARESHVQTIKMGLLHERNEYMSKLISIQALLTDPSTTFDVSFRLKLENILTKMRSKLL